MKINNFKNNKNLFFNFEENKFFGNRFHKNLDNEIYLYSFDEYNKEDKQILFLCEYSGCTAIMVGSSATSCGLFCVFFVSLKYFSLVASPPRIWRSALFFSSIL